MWSSSARNDALLRTFSSCTSRGTRLHPRNPNYTSRLLSLRPQFGRKNQACCSSGRAPQVDSRSTSNGVSNGNRVDPSENGPKQSSGGYPFGEIEAKWQTYWKSNKTFKTPEEIDMTKPKFYCLDMFPYPSGAGLHVGHPEGYTATDIIARYKRMKGYNVLHPMGWDAFGLPAEQYALKTNTHPRDTTQKNINRFKEQLQALGFSYDWDREISTTDPNYYRWTQWIFLKLFEKGLAYQAEVPVNWCPELGKRVYCAVWWHHSKHSFLKAWSSIQGTVLANEEVIDGKSERGGHPVVRLPMKQWMLKITEYADRLLEDLDDLDWSDGIKQMQRNWIGRSEGAQILFEVQQETTSDQKEVDHLEVYTTRPDTIFGATYMVVAPEHPLLESIVTQENRAGVEDYVNSAAAKSDRERAELQKDKTGVFTGAYAINPATDQPIPIWVADYVLGGYGSGAIMAVPGHDSRDYKFAETYNLGIKRVLSGDPGEDALPFTGNGRVVNSESVSTGLDVNGLEAEAACSTVISWLEAKQIGCKKVNYKLRDWLFARQRYWGEPFPIVFPDSSEDPVAIPEDHLPVTLPDTDKFEPSGTPESPLSNMVDWVSTTDPATGGPARRETSTMPQWAGSSWYYLRFIDPHNSGKPIDPEKEKYWMPVDLYVGGAEHAVLHLLYARFWHKVLYDLGVVSTKEPFRRLVSQGMILGEVEFFVHKDKSGAFVGEDHPDAEFVRLSEADVIKKGNGYVLNSDPNVEVSARAFKMSKSRGNVINPDDIVAEYGADSLRLYEMFMGPLIDTKTWSTRSVEGVYRFLARVHRLVAVDISEEDPTDDQQRLLHITIKKVTEDTEALRFNTAISSMMEFCNGAMKWPNRPRKALEPFIKLLSPYAPHLAEEMWNHMGHDKTITFEPWPIWDEAYLQESTVKIAIQTNGKMRGLIEIPKDAGQEEALEAAKMLKPVRAQIEGKEIKKIIFVPEKILNIIAR